MSDLSLLVVADLHPELSLSTVAESASWVSFASSVRYIYIVVVYIVKQIPS